LGPFFKGWCPDTILNIACTIFYYVGCSYFAIAFVLLNFCDFHEVYLSMYYAGHVFVVGSIPILLLFTPKQKKQRDAKKI